MIYKENTLYITPEKKLGAYTKFRYWFLLESKNIDDKIVWEFLRVERYNHSAYSEHNTCFICTKSQLLIDGNINIVEVLQPKKEHIDEFFASLFNAKGTSIT